MTDETMQSRFVEKKKMLEKKCLYGLRYFCDGTPNKSIINTDKPKPVCPKYYYCEIKKNKIFKH